MRLQELKPLNEETYSLQQIVRRQMKHVGTLGDVLGDDPDCDDACKYLDAGPTDHAYVMSSDTPQAEAAIRSVLNSASKFKDSKTLKMLLFAGRRLMIHNGKVFTSKKYFGDLVEAVGFRFSPSAQIDAVSFDSKQRQDDPQSKLGTSIRVSEILRKVHASDFSIDDENAIKDALAGKHPTDTLNIRDVDQIAVLANVDPEKFRDLLNME